MARWDGKASRKKYERKAFHWIPKPYSRLEWSLKIDGTTIPRGKIFGIKYSNAVTHEIGQCTILLNNNADDYDFEGGESIEIYVDYADGDTLQWKGDIEKVEKKFRGKGKTLKIIGRHTAHKLMDINVTKSYSDQTVQSIIDSLLSAYTDDFTYDSSTYPCSTTVTISWENKPFWECLIDLADIVQYDVYVNTDNEIVFFERESVLNTDEAVVHDNALSIDGLGNDLVKVRNKIRVNGRDDDGNPIVWTESDSTSQSNYNLREKPITDNSIKTVDDAKKRAEAELALLKDKETSGECESMIMVALNPGDEIYISYPMLDIHDTYRVTKFETNLYSSPPKTKVYINTVRGIPGLFKERMKMDLAHEDIQNPEDMNYTLNFTFDDATNLSSQTNTEVTDGFLKTTSGNNAGVAITNSDTPDNNITQAYMLVKGNNLIPTNYLVSNNGGNTWESITPKTLHSFTSTGQQITLKIELNSESTELDAVSLMYK